MWTILVQNKTFEGIRPTPNPKPNPDGSYTVTLTVTQWKVFQDNQKKSPLPVPARMPDDDEISVTKDRSTSLPCKISWIGLSQCYTFTLQKHWDLG